MARQPQPIEAILFDKDGTLIDLRLTWLPAYFAVVRELATLAGGGEDLARDLLRLQGYDSLRDRFDDRSPLMWDTNEAIAARWEKVPALQGVPDVAARVLFHLTDDQTYRPVPVGDVQALFGRLASNGYKLGIATMDDEAKARHLARSLALAPHLSFLAGCDSGYGLKPETGMIRAFCHAVRTAPERTAMVGDTHADLVMGRRAGCGLVIGVRTGGTPLQVLEREADIVLPSIMDIESVL
jgi:phosphoglycolate phosphatase